MSEVNFAYKEKRLSQTAKQHEDAVAMAFSVSDSLYKPNEGEVPEWLGRFTAGGTVYTNCQTEKGLMYDHRQYIARTDGEHDLKVNSEETKKRKSSLMNTIAYSHTILHYY